MTLLRRLINHFSKNRKSSEDLSDLNVKGFSLITRLRLEGLTTKDATDIAKICVQVERLLPTQDRENLRSTLAMALEQLEKTRRVEVLERHTSNAQSSILFILTLFVSIFAISTHAQTCRVPICRLLKKLLRTTSGLRPLVRISNALLSFVQFGPMPLNRRNQISRKLSSLQISRETLALLLELMAIAFCAQNTFSNHQALVILTALQAFIAHNDIIVLAHQSLWYQPIGASDYHLTQASPLVTYFEVVQILLPTRKGRCRYAPALQWAKPCAEFLSAVTHMTQCPPTIYLCLEVLYTYGNDLRTRTWRYLGLTFTLPIHLPPGTFSLLQHAATRAAYAVRRHPELLPYFVDSATQTAFIAESLVELPSPLWCEPLATCGMLEMPSAQDMPLCSRQENPYQHVRKNPITQQLEFGFVLKQPSHAFKPKQTTGALPTVTTLQSAAKTVSPIMGRKVASHLPTNA